MRSQEVKVRPISGYLGAGLILLIGVTALGCAQKSPEEKVAELRSYYSARLNGFILEEEPLVAEVPDPDALAEVEEGVEEALAEAAPTGPMGQVEVEQKVRLDILIQHRSDQRLPGITVDISMVDPDQVEKNHWRVWFDTSEVPKATVTQFTHILEDVGYEEGDGFFLEVRHPIPVEERGEYREFLTSPLDP
jgi:hypothetical protein